MRKSIKNIQLNVLTYVEVVIAFFVVTILLSAIISVDRTLFSSSEEIIFYSIFAGLALVVTALGIMGIQLMQVYRKKDEISLRRAVGATKLNIVHMIFRNTLFFILSPALIGSFLGLLTSTLYPLELLSHKVQFNYVAIPLCLGIILLMALLSGIPPAIKAISTNILDGFKSSKAVEHKFTPKSVSFFFYLCTGFLLISGIFINQRFEAAYQLDLKNTLGSPPAASSIAPSFAFLQEDGKIINSDNLYGETYCLMIYDVNCSVSGEAFRAITELVDNGDINAKDIYPVCLEQTLQDAKNYLNMNSLSLPLMVDYDKTTKWAFNAHILPAIYFIDEKGVILARSIGWTKETPEYILKLFEGK